MPPLPLRAALFDWDGTLVDSAAASYRCFRELFAHFEIVFDAEAYRSTYSPNWYRTYTALGLPEARWAEADRLWLDLYAAEESQLLPGAAEALTRLQARGIVQGLVTSGDRQRVTRELEALGVAQFFGVVLCHEDTVNRKPHPEALLLGLEQLGHQPAAAAYVGDSPEDVEMARAAGVFSVGVPGGFPNDEALRASTPDLLAGTLDEAIGALLA